jgi:hypothetical protein
LKVLSRRFCFRPFALAGQAQLFLAQPFLFFYLIRCISFVDVLIKKVGKKLLTPYLLFFCVRECSAFQGLPKNGYKLLRSPKPDELAPKVQLFRKSLRAQTAPGF